jgi:hypothetical protein
MSYTIDEWVYNNKNEEGKSHLDGEIEELKRLNEMLINELINLNDINNNTSYLIHLRHHIEQVINILKYLKKSIYVVSGEGFVEGS